MTTNVLKVLEKIKECKFLEDELYFTGGTALSYYIKHRISEDIDMVSPKTLRYKSIIPLVKSLGGAQMRDDKVSALKLAGLLPEEYMIKFIIDDVKLDFFQANRPAQKKIFESASFERYENSSLKILDLKSIAKLKIVALLERNKSRDLFDLGAILDHGVLTHSEILDVTMDTKNIDSMTKFYDFIKKKKEQRDDEMVYIDEDNPEYLIFDVIKANTLKSVKKYL
jgi:predicted nucleotidyltransferase component of viral defense system